jgi:hypothetical protein
MFADEIIKATLFETINNKLYTCGYYGKIKLKIEEMIGSNSFIIKCNYFPTNKESLPVGISQYIDKGLYEKLHQSADETIPLAIFLADKIISYLEGKNYSMVKEIDKILDNIRLKIDKTL